MFDESHAAAYDERFAKLAPMQDALHLVTQLALAELPADARVLCVGAGTGAELVHLAGALPGGASPRSIHRSRCCGAAAYGPKQLG
jgi:tRNA (cmo5U34)-methyltransferase